MLLIAIVLAVTTTPVVPLLMLAATGTVKAPWATTESTV